MQKILCITGMHRSGTSLTASWIQSCGLQIDDGKLIGAAVGNERGHFEDKEFVDLHSKYILKVWPDSKSWIVLNRRSFSDDLRREFLKEAQSLIDLRNEKFNFWGWKDPRTIIFLDLWKELLPHLKCLFVWRKADDVVDSLVRRSGNAKYKVFKIERMQSVLLWKTYNEIMLDYYKKHKSDSLLMPIEQLIRHDRQCIEVMNDKFGLELHHQKIENLIKDDLLLSAKPGLLSRLLNGWLGVGSIERELQANSEVLGAG